MSVVDSRQTLRPAIVIGALGVVFGDIGTSPIYTIQTVFSPADPHPVAVSTANVFGVVSLIFWSVMIIVTVTYILLALRIDNDGEGGIMALIALLRRWGAQRGRRAAVVLAAVGIFGASLFFGDGMITPAISVLSAIEGVEVVEPSLHELVVPITAVIIIALFLVQGRGTAAVGRVFGPVMILCSPSSAPAASPASCSTRRSSRRCPRRTRSVFWPGTSGSRSSPWPRSSSR